MKSGRYVPNNNGDYPSSVGIHDGGFEEVYLPLEVKLKINHLFDDELKSVYSWNTGGFKKKRYKKEVK